MMFPTMQESADRLSRLLDDSPPGAVACVVRVDDLANAMFIMVPFMQGRGKEVHLTEGGGAVRSRYAPPAPVKPTPPPLVCRHTRTIGAVSVTIEAATPDLLLEAVRKLDQL